MRFHFAATNNVPCFFLKKITVGPVPPISTADQPPPPQTPRLQVKP
jgi:hypothetical protein